MNIKLCTDWKISQAISLINISKILITLENTLILTEISHS